MEPNTIWFGFRKYKGYIMFIQTEKTPNPSTLKFIPGHTIIKGGTVNFSKAEDAINISNFAVALFTIEGITGVFLGGEFITLTKASDADWVDLKPKVLGEMIDYLSSDKSIMVENANLKDTEVQKTFTTDEQSIVDQIKELLDSRVRPAVAQDGGDIIFHDYDEGIVYLSMLGACEGCPSSTATLKIGIENMLKYYIPEIIEVRAIN